jgi:DNA-binding MarR family transcriptional regulator
MPGEDPAPALHEALTQNTGFLVSRVGIVAAKAFAERIAEVGLTPRGWGALSVLDQEGPITQQQLGTFIGMDPSTMVATIDELEAQGLVERRRNPEDRRAHALHVTAQGRRTVGRGRKVARRAQDDLLAPLTTEERQQLHDLLLQIVPGGAQASAATSSERAVTG